MENFFLVEKQFGENFLSRQKMYIKKRWNVCWVTLKGNDISLQHFHFVKRKYQKATGYFLIEIYLA